MVFARSSSGFGKDAGGSIIFSLGISLLIFSTLSRSFSFWQPDGPVIIPSLYWGMAVSLAVIASGIAHSHLRRQVLRIDERGFILGLLILFFSDWLAKSYNLLQGPAIRGEIILGALLGAILLRNRLGWTISALSPLAVGLLIYSFLSVSDGRLIFSDDHPTFLYRLSLLKDNFPAIPFYYPFWNGGVDAREFFATGAINIFLLSSPLLYVFEPAKVYNYIAVFAVLCLPAICCYFACKIERVPAPGPAISAVLAIAATLLWYRWGFKYGTMGFITAASLLPLNLSLASKVICNVRPLPLWQAALFVVSATLMLCWTPSGLVFIPLIFISLLLLPRLLRKRYVLPLAFTLLVVNLPWILLFWSVSNVGSFLATERPSFTEMHEVPPQAVEAAPEDERETGRRDVIEQLNLSKGLSILRESSVSSNPLLFMLLIPGLFSLKRNYSRAAYLVTALWLLFLGSIVSPLKPQLELDRMLVILSLIAVVPVSSVIALAIRRASHRMASWDSVALASVATGFLFASVFSANSVVLNRSIEQYHFADDSVSSMKEAILRHHRGGRILFSGFVLHELSHGHLAPLTEFTRVPLIASSYMHDKWKYEQVFPASFIRRGDEGIDDYLKYYNVSAVFAHEPHWRNYFQQRDGFELVWSEGRFRLFTVPNFPDSYFLEGEGKILEQRSNGLSLRTTSRSAVIKFNYFPFLTVREGSCELNPRKLNEITLIELTNCTPGEEIVIESVSPYQRLVPLPKNFFIIKTAALGSAEARPNIDLVLLPEKRGKNEVFSRKVNDLLYQHTVSTR